MHQHPHCGFQPAPRHAKSYSRQENRDDGVPCLVNKKVVFGMGDLVFLFWLSCHSLLVLHIVWLRRTLGLRGGEEELLHLFHTGLPWYFCASSTSHVLYSRFLLSFAISSLRSYIDVRHKVHGDLSLQSVLAQFWAQLSVLPCLLRNLGDHIKSILPYR